VAAQYHQKGVVFVGVNIWDKEPDARRFIQEKGIPYFVGRDGDESISKAYDIEGTPITFFIGGDGKIVAVHEGAMSEEDLVAQVKALMQASPPKKSPRR